ncbi:MAG: pyrroline-5-carboxylate reductase [Bifidobacteriaceae bacterium]|nr:pyrroline-5-carboxylate reductase [Bifidobacteriaceae bacterium]
MIGFIGYGNMAQAIVQGLVEHDVVQAKDIIACAAHYNKLEENAKKYGIIPCHSVQDVINTADVIVIAIKPYQIESVLTPFAQQLAESKKCIISLAAGWNLAQYQKLLGNKVAVQCIIPNTPIAVGRGVVVSEDVHTLSQAQQDEFERLFGSIALIERVDSAHMNIAMSIAGCAPAFTDMYLEALGDAGVKHGLQRQTAYRIAAKMIEGVGALYSATGSHPGVMKDAVCSPGGTTIKGVAELERQGFRGSVIAAVDAIENAK